MENIRLNSCPHTQVQATPGDVAQYPQAVVPVYYPTGFVPCSRHASVPDSSVGLQYRTVAQHVSVPVYQQNLQLAMSCPVAQVVEKRSETTSGSLVEYSYLPAASGYPFPPQPAAGGGWNGFCHRHRAAHPRGLPFHPVQRNLRPSFQSGPGQVDHRPSLTGPVADLRQEYPHSIPVAKSLGANAIADLPAPFLTPETLKITRPPPDCTLPMIDLTALLPDPYPRGDMDPDMKLLYLKHLLTSQLPGAWQSHNFFIRLQGNYSLHNNPDIPRFGERQRMIASLTSHFGETNEFEDIRKSKSFFTAILRKMQQKGWVNPSETIKPAHCILLCIAPFLPCTTNHNVSLCAQYLRPYNIPFSAFESLTAANGKSRQKEDVSGHKPLHSDNGTNQLSIILLVMGILAKTFPIKLCRLRDADGTTDSKDVIIHSKFVAHMVLTALLFCQLDTSTQNISQFLTITGYFLKHLTSINQFPGLCDEAGMDLTRALLTLLSHDVARTELLALMQSAASNADPSFGDLYADQRLQQTVRSKNGLADRLEDSQIRSGQALIRNLQSLLITTLKRCLRPDAAPYYFATLATLSGLPLFSPQLIRRESDNWQVLIDHLTNVIDWMEQSLQKDSRCYTDLALLRKIMDTIISVWIPGLSFQVATMAGWRPETNLRMSDKQWLLKQLRAPAGGQFKYLPELLFLARGLQQLEQEALRKKIEEDKSSRESESEANALVQRIIGLKNKKNQKIVREQFQWLPRQSEPRLCSHHGQNQYQKSREQPPSSPAFVTRVTDFCHSLDYSTGLGDLKAAVVQDNKLVHSSHQLWLYTEMAFQGFHRHRELIIRSARAMSNARRTHKKLTEALAEPKADFVNKWQSSNWLNERFTPSELSPKRLAEMITQTEPEKLARARRVMSNVLALFKLAIKPGSQLLEEVGNDGKLTGELSGHELMVHFDFCHEALQMLVGRVKPALEREVISHELPGLKTQLFQQLHLQEADSVEQSYHGPEDTESLQTLKALEQGSEAYRAYNQQPFDKIDAQELVSSFLKIHLGLLRHWHNHRVRAPDAAGQAVGSEPEVARADPADQQRSAVDADASKHQEGSLGDPLP